MLDFTTMMNNVKKVNPLVHCMTNYVTVNDCANVVLACGGSPIMTDELEEVEDIAAISKALVINIGTLNKRTVASMLAAGKKANQAGVPVVLDPVGAGASPLRDRTCKELLDTVNFAVIRGNISEIKALALGSGSTKGVDAAAADRIDESNVDSVIDFLKVFSEKTGAVIVVSGAVDLVVFGNRVALIRNGHPMMADITGSGCMLTAVLAAYVGANEDAFDAVTAAMCLYGYAGELAQRKAAEKQAGNATFRNYLIDHVYLMTAEALTEGADYELR